MQRRAVKFKLHWLPEPALGAANIPAAGGAVFVAGFLALIVKHIGNIGQANAGAGGAAQQVHVSVEIFMVYVTGAVVYPRADFTAPAVQLVLAMRITSTISKGPCSPTYNLPSTVSSWPVQRF